MFTKKQINKFLKIGLSNDNVINKYDNIIETLREAKLKIQKHGAIPNIFIFNPNITKYIQSEIVKCRVQEDEISTNETKKFIEDMSNFGLKEDTENILKDYLSESLKHELKVNLNELWGTDIIYSEYVPIDKGIALSMELGTPLLTDSNNNAVAVFSI